MVSMKLFYDNIANCIKRNKVFAVLAFLMLMSWISGSESFRLLTEKLKYTVIFNINNCDSAALYVVYSAEIFIFLILIKNLSKSKIGYIFNPILLCVMVLISSLEFSFLSYIFDGVNLFLIFIVFFFINILLGIFCTLNFPCNKNNKTKEASKILLVLIYSLYLIKVYLISCN